LAGKSTLNRLELTSETASAASRYKKIAARDADIEAFFVEELIDAHRDAPMPRIVLDIDPSDIELHGAQEGRFFHGYYGHYCYLPLYIFCGEHVLLARLRESDIDGSSGTVEALEWLVPQLRQQWPDAEIAVRADSGIAREKILVWCEANGVEYVIGLSRNPRLEAMIVDDLAAVKARHEESGKPERGFVELSYRTKRSWSRRRRVVAKAEQLDLFGERASCMEMRANQLRVWESAVAHLLMVEFRRTALAGTPLERAQTNTIRVRLLKVGALVTVSVRRVRIALSSVFPLQAVFRTALAQIQATWLVPA